MRAAVPPATCRRGSGPLRRGRRGDPFADAERGRDDRDQWVEIDIVRGSYGSEPVHGGVPQDVAEHRRDDAQKQQVAPHRGTRQYLRADREGLEGEYRKNRQQSVEEDLAGDENGGVAPSDAFDRQRIDHLQQRRGQGQQIAFGREVQHETVVENHQHHARERQRRSPDLPPRHPLAAVCEAQQQRGPYRRRADDQRHVRRRGVFLRHVFGQEIERSARHPGRGQQRFVAPSVGPQAAFRQGPDADVGQGETQQEYLRRRQRMGDQHLRRYERRAPYRHGEQRRCMVLVFGIFYHTAPKIQIFCRPGANLNS